MAEKSAYVDAEAEFKSALELLDAVGNPKQIWITLSHLAQLYEKMNRRDLAREQWQAAAKVVQKTVDALFDHQLREDFLNAQPVREILLRGER